MSAPYTPTALATPIINPAIGGTANAYPYVSPSQYKFAPTAMDATTLVPTGSATAQLQSLSDTIRRASGWADRYVFGADPASKGASMGATLSVESAFVPIVGGEIRLVCDYKPPIALVGCTAGSDPANLQSIGSVLAGRVRFGRRTIFVPLANRYWFGPNNQTSAQPISTTPTGQVYCVWSYVNGYPHTQLATSAAKGATSITVEPTDGGTGLYGVFPGTQLFIYDGADTELVTVSKVTGTTLTLKAGLRFAHTVPTLPDFLPVTALPPDVQLAVIFFTTALIKTRGDNALVLDELREPSQLTKTVGDVEEDVAYAMELLDPFRVRLKGHT